MSFTHDPRKMMENLRDNLARHDKPIGFLFGAGTSSSVNVAAEPANEEERGFEPLIPSVAQLTEQCHEEVRKLGDDFSNAWDIIEAECNRVNQNPNIENILSRVQTKRVAIGAGDKLAGIDAEGFEKFEESIRKNIAQAVQPDESLIPEIIPHDEFSLWIAKTARQRPIEIFTLNYDILLERSFEANGVPIFDGFVGSYEPFFSPESICRDEMMPGKAWTRLWKIHGSVNWRRVSKGNQKRIIRGAVDLSGEMILPSHHKYDESRKQPYIALIEHLGRFLDQDDALLFTLGFSWGDEHINSVIFTALSSRPRTHVIALQFADLESDDQILQQARRLRNLTVLHPAGAVIGGVEGAWRLVEALDTRTKGFMEPAFDLDPPEQEDRPSLSGKMRLGDFNAFCGFLSEIVGTRD